MSWMTKQGFEAERAVWARSVERLEMELARAHETLGDLRQELTEARERADLAADRLMEVYGRSGISAAYGRASRHTADAAEGFARAASHDPLAPVAIGSPECQFANEEEARGDYA